MRKLRKPEGMKLKEGMKNRNVENNVLTKKTDDKKKEYLKKILLTKK